MPTQEQVEQKAEEIDQNESLLTSILLFPERILGGQMVKGLLAGEGERGAADNLKRGFLNNPIFQVTDMLGITDLTRQVDFAEVRESGAVDFLGIGGRGKRVREGFGNFAINLVGDIVTDPLGLMLNPFGRTPTAAAKAGVQAGTKTVAGTVVKKTLVEQVEQGVRAMAVFNVPFTNYGFVAPTPKNLDLAIAKGLSKTAEKINQDPLVRSIAKTFNRGFLGAKTLSNGDQVITGAEQNLFMQGALEGSAEYARNLTRPQYEKLNEIAQQYSDMLTKGDAEDIRFTTMALLELGVSGLDTEASLRHLLVSGPEYGKAQDRLFKLLTDTSDEALAFQKLREDAITFGSTAAARELRARFPDVSIYMDSNFINRKKLTERMGALGLEPKPGVDFRGDTRQFGFDVTPDRELLQAQATPLNPPSELIRPLGDPDRLRPAQLADEVVAPENAAVAGVKEKALGAFDRLKAAGGTDLVESLGRLVGDMNGLMYDVGTKDVIEGLINMTTGPYLPRIVDPRVLEALDAAFINGVKKKFPNAYKAMSFFREQRKFTRMTALEVNALAREIGINFTGNRPLKEFQESVQSGVHSLLAKVFEGDTLEALKKLGPDGKAAWEFFSGNPMHAFNVRLNASREMIERGHLAKSLVAKDSPMILWDGTLQQALENPELLHPDTNGWGRELSLFVVDEKGAMSHLRADQVVRGALDQDLSSKRILATRFMRDEIARQVSEGNMSLDEALGQIRPALSLNSKSADADLLVRDTDMDAVRTLKGHIQDIKRIDNEPVLVPERRGLEPLGGDGLPAPTAPSKRSIKRAKGDLEPTPMAPTGARFTNRRFRDALKGARSSEPGKPIKAVDAPVDYPVVREARKRVDAEKAKLRELIEQRAGAKKGAVEARYEGEFPEPGVAVTRTPEESFIDDVYAAASQMKHGLFDEPPAGQFLIADLHDVYAKSGGKLSLDEFKSRLLKANLSGAPIDLTRLDYVEAVIGRRGDAGMEQLRRSLTKDRGSDRHIVKLSQFGKYQPPQAGRPAGSALGGKPTMEGAPRPARVPKAGGKTPPDVFTDAEMRRGQTPEGVDLEIRIRRQREAVQAARKEFAEFSKRHRESVRFSREEAQAARVRAELEAEVAAPQPKMVAGEPTGREVLRTKREQAEVVLEAKRTLKREKETLEDIRLSREAGEISPARAREQMEQQKLRIDEARAALEGARGDAARIRTELDIRRRDAWSRVADMRQAIREEIEEVVSIRRQLLGEGKTEAQVRAGMMKRITQEATATGDLEAQAIEIMKHQRRYGAIAMEELRAKYPEMYQRLVDRQANTRVVAMDAEVASEIYGAKGFLDRLYAPDKWAQTMRGFDHATQWWKQWTLAFPQTRVRDMVTNFVMLTMGGARVTRLVESAEKGSGLHEAMRRALNNDFSLLDTIKIARKDGAELTGRELYEKMYAKGMLSGGYLRDEITAHGMQAAFDIGGQPAAEKFLGGFMNGLLPPIGPLKNLPPASSNPIIKANHNLADWGDGYAKIHGTLAHWLDGSDLEDALQVTNAWLYNPSHGKTAIERQVFSRFLPFYNWARFAVKNQVQAYFKHPGSLQTWEKARQAALTAAGVDEGEWDDVLPDFVTENFGIPDPGFPLWRQSKEGPEFYLFGSYIPIGEINQIASALENIRETDGASLVDYFGTRLNPGVKYAIETVANRSFFSGRDIEQFPGEHAEMFGVPMPRHVANFIQNFRFLNELDRLNVLSFKDWDEVRFAMGDATPRGQLGTRAEMDFTQRLLSGAFGILPRGQLVDADEEARFKRGQLERQRSKYKGMLRRRIEEQDRPNRKADIESIQSEIAETIARLNNLNRVSPDPDEVRR